MHSALLFLPIPVHKGFTRLEVNLMNFGTQFGFSCKVVIASWIAEMSTPRSLASYKVENDSVIISINPETAHMI